MSFIVDKAVHYLCVLFCHCQKWHNSLYALDLRRRLKGFGEHLQVDASSTFHGENYIAFGENFRSGKNCKFRCFSVFHSQVFSPEMRIGDDFLCGSNCYLSCIIGILIGNHVTLANNITIIDHNHGKSDFSDLEIPVLERELFSKGPIVIGDNVWLAEGVIVLGGVKIGKNSIIGAGSVVTHDIPSNCIAAGNPAKIIRYVEKT